MMRNFWLYLINIMKGFLHLSVLDMTISDAWVIVVIKFAILYNNLRHKADWVALLTCVSCFEDTPNHLKKTFVLSWRIVKFVGQFPEEMVKILFLSIDLINIWITWKEKTMLPSWYGSMFWIFFFLELQPSSIPLPHFIFSFFFLCSQYIQTFFFSICLEYQKIENIRSYVGFFFLFFHFIFLWVFKLLSEEKRQKYVVKVSRDPVRERIATLQGGPKYSHAGCVIEKMI
jgi:hypothetical protein